MLVHRGRALREVVVDKVQRVVDGCDGSVHVRDTGRGYWTNLESDLAVAVGDVLVAQRVRESRGGFQCGQPRLESCREFRRNLSFRMDRTLRSGSVMRKMCRMMSFHHAC
jgi:hypothetical protein